MAETTIKTRVKLLTKSYQEWQAIKDTFVPLKGEMCIVEVPASAGAVVQEPAVLFKVGDGTSTFGSLSYSSALAADVYNWAKKANLDWSDISATFKNSLKEYISQELPGALYQLVSDGTHKWKLQKSTDGTTWTDAGNIDITDIDAALAKKVTRELTSANGKAYIFNETDGGGAKFEHTDGTYSAIAVNDGGKDGIAAQIYAIDSTSKEGTRINITKDGIYYTKKANATYETNDELVTKKDIKDITGGIRFIGVTDLQAGETYAQAIQRLLTEKGKTATAGDLVIIRNNGSSKEFIYDGTTWQELGDESLYATKAELNQEIEDRQEAVEGRELVVLAVDDFGFDTNLRVNQTVTGKDLIDRVILETETNRRQAVIKSGDYEYNVISIVNDQVKGICGFAAETMFIDTTAELSTQVPATEKCVFLYTSTLGKTYTFYGKDFTSKEVQAKFDALATIASTGNVKDLVQTSGDVLILDCN